MSIYTTLNPVDNKIPQSSYPINGAVPEVLFITSYSPVLCHVSDYSHNLLKSFTQMFNSSFSTVVCALESENEKKLYTGEVGYTLDPGCEQAYTKLATAINFNSRIRAIVIQYEFNLFDSCAGALQDFVGVLNKPVVIAFHKTPSQPDKLLKLRIQHLAAAVSAVIVMTEGCAQQLIDIYGIAAKKINTIPYGTQLATHFDKELLKQKYNFSKRKVLSTFGLLNKGKGIETMLLALPEIIKQHPDVYFLIIGKTHPDVEKQTGELYRNTLESLVKVLGIKEHVKFINAYLPQAELLEYLQLTDICLFAAKNEIQPESKAACAMSCGCAVVSIPLSEIDTTASANLTGTGQHKQLSSTVNELLANEASKNKNALNGLNKAAARAWENVAIAYAALLEKVTGGEISFAYNLPVIKLDHLKKLTSDFGIIQFSKINQPDLSSGYTLNDNAHALIAMCQHYEVTANEADLSYISVYLNFLKHCLQTEGYFLNHVNSKRNFTSQNNSTNLADANGRAFWALGYLISKRDILPVALIEIAEAIMKQALFRINAMHSTRSMAFTIKGLYYCNIGKALPKYSSLIKILANRLVQMYRNECEGRWLWFENYLTYANSILPEALLCAYLDTGDEVYKKIAKDSFDFLLSKTFNEAGIKVISKKSWLHKGEKGEHYGEQPVDVAYSIIALNTFYAVFKQADYSHKLEMAFNWFHGNNQLSQIIYNPYTGGCYDGLEEKQVNLNQGAESTVSYLVARLSLEQHLRNKQKDEFSPQAQVQNQLVTAC